MIEKAMPIAESSPNGMGIYGKTVAFVAMVQLRTLFETIDSMLFRIDRIKCRREPLLPPAFCSPHIISVDAILTCSAATVRHFSAAAARSAPLAR